MRRRQPRCPGHGTCSGSIPKVQDDLYDEVRGQLQGRSPTLDDLPALPLAKAVFEEALRLYPPV